MAWPASPTPDLCCSDLTQKYIEKVKVLVKQGMQDPSGPALAELESVMSIRVSRAALPGARRGRPKCMGVLPGRLDCA